MSSSVNTKDTEYAWDKLGVTTIPISSMHEALDVMWEMDKRITLCLIGDTGVGKTPIIHQWAKQHGGFICPLNLGHIDQESIAMSMFNEDATEYDFVQAKWFAELNREAEEKGRAVLFLDEWNRGDKSIVNTLFTLTDERRIHNHHLHDNVLVVAAMNPSIGTYLVNEAERDPAIRKRLCFVYTVVDLIGFLDHATEAEFHTDVVSYIRAQPTALYDTAARDAGKAFPCPANWEKVSNILKASERRQLRMESSTVLSLVAGQIGFTHATRFLDYVQDHNTVIEPDEVLYRYADTGRKRVAALMGYEIDKEGILHKQEGKPLRADALTTLNQSVALLLFSTEPNPVEICDNLAQYYVDLPDELAISLFGESIRERVSSGGAKAAGYLSRLSSLLSKHPEFSEKVRRMSHTAAELAKAQED